MGNSISSSKIINLKEKGYTCNINGKTPTLVSTQNNTTTIVFPLVSEGTDWTIDSDAKKLISTDASPLITSDNIDTKCEKIINAPLNIIDFVGCYNYKNFGKDKNMWDENSQGEDLS